MSSSTSKPQKPDVEVIVPEAGEVTIEGVTCNVRRLRTREFLALMKVLTRGLGSGLSEVRLDFSDGDAVARDLSALMLLAIPNAFGEFCLFLTTIVEPTDETKRGVIVQYLNDNPDLDVLLAVFEKVAVQEKDDLSALAGKAQAMWSRVASLYSSPAVGRLTTA